MRRVWGRLPAVKSIRAKLSLCVCALAITLASPAPGFELFGVSLFGNPDAEAVIADPQPYDLTISTHAAGPLDAAIRNASDLAAKKDQPASGAAGLLASARGDYARILGALYQEGYYGGAVSILVGGREAATLPPDTTLPKPVPVAILVQPGPAFRFGAIRIANRAPVTNDQGDLVPAPEDQGFAAGQPARSSAIIRAETLALNAWRQLGYPKARVEKRDVVADHQTQRLDVLISIDPGRRASIGDVTVSGTEHVDPAFVARQSGLVPGREYDPDDVAQAQKRLARLEVFQSLRLEAAETISDDGDLPYAIIVQEMAQRRFGFGATYSSIDGFGVEGFWLHRNLFGQAERLRLDAKIAGIAFPLDSAAFDYAFGGTFTKPGLFTPDTDLIAAISAERTVLPTYSETSAMARLGLSHMLSDEITFEAGLLGERNRFEDDFGTRDFATLGAYGIAELDFRNDRVDPTQGFYARATVDPFYEFSFGNPALQATGELRGYFGFGQDDQFVLAGRFKAGVLLGPGLSEIPPDRLFFAGGGGSVRGYGYRSIGVDSGGTVSGGRYLLEASAEARVRINETFGAVAFIDGGYVAADTFPGLDQLRIGAGVGLRYYTGFGPLRADIAIPLNKRSGDPDYAIYVGIGQSF